MAQCESDLFYQAFCKAEIQAIEEHKYYLSEKAGHDVGLKFAVTDWLINHAAAWREERLHSELAAQRQEMSIHKWIESEKAGRDLGIEAVQDWIRHFAASWRQWRDRQEECRQS